MKALSVGSARGISQGISQGIKGTVAILRRSGYMDAYIVEQIMEEYQLTLKEAEQYVTASGSA